MWVWRSRWRATDAARVQAEADRDAHARTLAAQVDQYTQLHQQFTQANRQYAVAVADLQREVRALLERLITSEAEGRKASALIAFWSVRVNQLQHERDTLLARALPGLDVRSPQIAAVSLLEPALSFDHQPDLTAPLDANGLIPVPDLDPYASGDLFADLGGLPGSVYTPSAEG